MNFKITYLSGKVETDCYVDLKAAKKQAPKLHPYDKVIKIEEVKQ